MSLAAKERARLKILKTLAIAYLLWALFYSLTFGTFWVINALGFKLNGGPQLVGRLDEAGYGVQRVQVDKENRFLSLSL